MTFLLFLSRNVFREEKKSTVLPQELKLYAEEQHYNPLLLKNWCSHFIIYLSSFTKNILKSSNTDIFPFYSENFKNSELKI